MKFGFRHFLVPAAAGAAAGFRKPLYFISTGYGAAMALQAGMAMTNGGWARADTLGKVHLAAIAAYGVRLAGFVLWRDNLPSYQARKESNDAKLKDFPLWKSLFMWGGVTPLYWAMFAPAYLNAAPGAAAAAAASPALRAFSAYVAAPLMVGALVWEALADVQQQRDKERQRGAKTKKPCMSGVWRYSTQANYFGEAAFWLASYGAGLRAYAGVPQALGAAVGTAAIVAIIASECTRRAREREERYGDLPEWQEYKARTAQIVPFAPWIRTTPKPLDPSKPEKFRL